MCHLPLRMEKVLLASVPAALLAVAHKAGKDRWEAWDCQHHRITPDASTYVVVGVAPPVTYVVETGQSVIVMMTVVPAPSTC